MLLYKHEKIALFIDGASLYGATKSLGFEVDWKKFFKMFAEQGILVRPFYYTILSEGEDFTPLRPLVDFLDYHGWTMRTKPAKEFTDSSNRKKSKGSMDVELAVDAMATTPYVDHLIIGSGDADFVPLIHGLKRLGKRVSVLSTIKVSPHPCTDELRRAADNFIDLEDIRSMIARVPAATSVGAGLKPPTKWDKPINA